MSQSHAMQARASPVVKTEVKLGTVQRKSAAVPAYLQRKAFVSRSHDPAEREADSTAKAVMAMPAPPISSSATGVQRKAPDAAPAPSVPSISATGGMPLSPSIRKFFEPRFKANFSGVRIHNDEQAFKMAKAMNARAFTTGNHIYFAANQYQPETQEGMELLAHELTHTIQQGATIQRKVAGADITQKPLSQIQQFGLSDVLDYFADKANIIPGYRMFTIILGLNPINMSKVERSAANILRALVEFIPGGYIITQALDRYQVFEKAGAWVELQINELGLTGSAIRKSLDDFIDGLGWRDLFHPFDIWERAANIFIRPIKSIITLGKRVGVAILQFIRDAVLIPLAKLAEGTRGWDLVCALLGKNPISGEAVPQTAETLIPGFMKLIGKEEVWKRVQEGKALSRVWSWFKTAMAEVIAMVTGFPAKFIATLKSLEVGDFLLLPKAIAKILGVFGSFVVGFISWAGNTVWKLLEIIFSVVSPSSWKYIQKTGAALRSILTNPLPFVKNLGKAAKDGFGGFKDNFMGYLKDGIIGWLTGNMPGVYLPKSLDLKEIARFVLSVLGLTWTNLRGKMVKAIGETAVVVLETTFDIVVTLVRDGPAAAWEQIKTQLSNLKEMAIGAIIDFVVDIVTKKAIPKLISMFIPGLGFVSAIISVYDMVMVVVERISQIVKLVTGFIDSITAIASGNTSAASKKIESVLANGLSLAIVFAAGFASIGRIADKLRGVLEKIRAPFDKAMDWLVGWIEKAAKAVGKLVAKGASAIADWWKERNNFTNADGESHTLLFSGSGASSKLMIHSVEQTVEGYLASYPDKDSADYKTAKSVFDRANRVIFTPLKKDGDEQERRKVIKQQLADISAAFVRLSGSPPQASDYPKSKEPTYNPYEVEHLVGDPASAGTKPKQGPNTGTPGWKEVYDAGLTTASDKWVQMHVISEQLGGKGIPSNLVPAPNSVNTGPFRSFEHQTKGLAKASSKKIKNVVWVKFKVSTHDGTYAKSIQGTSGLYFWKGKTGSPVWIKNDSYSFYSQAAIPLPDLVGNKKLSLNFSSGKDLRDFGVEDKLANVIKENRRYPSLAVFVDRVEAKALEAKIANPRPKLQNLVGNPKVELNGPSS